MSTLKPPGRGAVVAAVVLTALFFAARPETLRLRAAVSLVVLGGITWLAAQLVPERRPATTSEPEPHRRPGEDPTLLGGLRAAGTDTSFRIFGVLGLVLLVVWDVVMRPVDVVVSGGGHDETLSCGARTFLFGADNDAVSTTCRDAFASRAAGGFLVLVGFGVLVAMMAWIVQYYRGAALGAVWHSRRVPTLLVTRTGGACALLAAVAVFAAVGDVAPVRVEGTRRAAAAVPPAPGAPFEENLIPQPEFDDFAPVDVLSPTLGYSSPPPSAPSPAATTSTTQPRPPAPRPLTVHDASWFTARPSPVEDARVPDGSLPVAVTGGRDETHALFRVRGTAPVLRLVESSERGTQVFPAAARVKACPVTTADWDQTRGASLEDKPPYDDGACVTAVRADDGSWTIDLGGFEDRGGRRGFVLVPILDVEGQTFRVTLVAAPEQAS